MPLDFQPRFYSRRIRKELELFARRPPLGMSLEDYIIEEDYRFCFINVQGAAGTLYDGQELRLQIEFHSMYPFEAPKVSFIGENIPVHPQFDSDGRVRSSILNDDWSPIITLHTICHLILNLLSSCR